MDTNYQIPFVPNTPTVLTANSDTVFKFASQVTNLFIQNNTSSNINIDFDQAAKSGSILLQPGQYYSSDKAKITTVHILGTAASNVNGSSASNIIVKGWE